MSDVDARPPMVQGYLDEISATHATGWMWHPLAPDARLACQLVLELPEGCEVLAESVADRFYAPLDGGDTGDARYGFSLPVPTGLSPQARRQLAVRPLPDATLPDPTSLPRAPAIDGYLDERSEHHVAGWIRNRFDPQERVAFEIVLARADAPECVLARGVAELANPMLTQQAIGDGRYGFRVMYERPLTEAECDAILVRPAGGAALPLSPFLVTAFEPIDHIALDIVNNCNLRCPFCLFDYSEIRTTRVMSREIFERTLPLLPYVRDGNFWLSCLHEPTLNPDFLGFIERIPLQWRRKVMFTTNLARRMPASYFSALAQSGVSHINISLESLDPGIFERMRKGAKWPIFKENWDRLIAAWKAAPAPPRLRYIIMAFQANLAEIPELVRFLRAERMPWQVEVRHTYNALHIPADFRRNEFLKEADWAWLATQFAAYHPDEVMLISPTEVFEAPAAAPAPDTGLHDAPGSRLFAMPWQFTFEPAFEPLIYQQPVPAEPVETDERRLSQPFNLQIEWDGRLAVYGKWNDPPELKKFAEINIEKLTDPYAYLMSL